MSGHSKWHNIQGKKGKADAAKSNLFTKLSRAMTMAARQGGSDAEMNFALRLVIEKAKAANMPKDNIERAIKRGTGELAGDTLEEIVYEGFGPQGIALLIETVTDNKTRTVAEIKHLLSKHGGSLGSPGTVAWQFERKGVVRVGRDTSELVLIDAGADAIDESEFGFEVMCAKEKLATFKAALETAHIPIIDAGLEWVPKERIAITPDTQEKLDALLSILDALDDVKEVYTNV